MIAHTRRSIRAAASCVARGPLRAVQRSAQNPPSHVPIPPATTRIAPNVVAPLLTGSPYTSARNFGAQYPNPPIANVCAA